MYIILKDNIMIKGILIFILCFSILYLCLEAIYFFRALKSGEYNISNWRLLGIGLALSYITTIIFTGL